MAITLMFAVRGTSLDARYAPGGATSAKMNTATITAGAGAGIIGDSVINLDQAATAVHALCWPAKNNVATSRKFSVLLRCAFGATTTIALCNIGPACRQIGNWGAWFDSNTLNNYMESYVNGGDVSHDTQALVPVLGTYYDIVWTNDMSSTGANNLKTYVDGSLVGSGSAGAVWPSPRIIDTHTITLGSTAFTGAGDTRIKVNEFCIWDDIIDPTSIALTSGTGSLNGASRTAFVNASALDGAVNTDPGIGNVKNGTTYSISGVSLTGALVAGVPGGGNAGKNNHLG